ncbi:hypothetical protein [Enterobacillus tribolii]|uniref:Tetratricopeptide repeat protein n=1 Tax=Enterobacillus tribolii TaxID=1487935 RepID=A0A370QGD6_9GAMM|nr:hypothetical protein [Enterobacillus tribolii]MBW7981745.1 hypothetical protein [Enterobacillus tribolii]RDK87428.1 hypothetical protein C8D90_10923 [Enterobacillus tribolii]
MLRPEFSRFPLKMLVISALGIALPGQACGPDFPYRLLLDRNATLLYMPEGNYAFEASRLATFDDGLPRWQQPAEPEAPAPAIAQLRGSSSLAEAEQMKVDLPEAARLYTLGALAFHLRDGAKAADYFRQVLALPAEQQSDWGLKARYSLGRALMGDFPAQEEGGATATDGRAEPAALREALQVFGEVVEAVKAGAPDPAYLSLASLGQAGRISVWLGDLPGAAHLYARQAAQGDPVGGLSLQYLSAYLIKTANRAALEKSIDDPLIQQLVTIELFTRSGNLQWADNNNSPEDVARTVSGVVELLGRHVKTGFAGSDRLAALAYRAGNYPLTETLLKNAGDGGLSWWLRAKMALRKGDVATATANYARAAAAFPSDESWGDQRNESFEQENIVPVCRVSGEQAILALNRGEYVQAMTLLYRGKDIYWQDVADIAERVLTLDELRQFVDKNAPPPATPLKPRAGEQYDWQPLTPDLQLRELLARRLMRVGRYEDALRYFDIPNYRQSAQELAGLLAQGADKKSNKVARAGAYYQAAVRLRTEGMALTGYEMTPDYAVYEGSFSYLGDAFDTRERKEKSWISVAEASRAKQSLPVADQRFLHYRWQAVKLAEKAADLLPPKSQPYAAVLCNAAGWVIARDAKTGRALYKRYIANGTQYDWTPGFGYNCPKPDFGSVK